MHYFAKVDYINAECRSRLIHRGVFDTIVFDDKELWLSVHCHYHNSIDYIACKHIMVSRQERD